MTKYTLPPHAAELLAIYGFGSGADSFDSLFWRDDDGVISFYAICSDTFAPAGGDCEEILPEDIDLLWECLNDLRPHNEEFLLSELFAARKRGKEPLERWLKAWDSAELFRQKDKT